MSSESPDIVIYDVNGLPMAVQNATAIPASTSALIVAGSDGTNSRYILLDSSGRPIVVGAGTAGSPNGGVLSVQGIAGGTAISVTSAIDTLPSSINITTFDASSISTVYSNQQILVTGTPTANSAASFAISSIDSVLIQVTGNWSGTLSIESSIDGGTTWTAIAVSLTGLQLITSISTQNFVGGTNVAGCTNIRVRALTTSIWTGTAIVLVVESVNSNIISIDNLPTTEPILTRQSSLVPQLPVIYTTQRVKLSTGDFSQDFGDINPATALPTRLLFERWALEEQTVHAFELQTNNFADSRGRSGNRAQTLDNRGGVMRGSSR